MMKRKFTLIKKFFYGTSRTTARVLSAVAVVAMSSTFFGQTISSGVPITSGTGTFTVPSCVTQITVEAWGGGGGGGVRSNSNRAAGPGGGGGAYGKVVLNVVPGEVYTYIVGKGGEGKTDGSTSDIPPNFSGWKNVKDGEASIFSRAGSSLTANGGGGALDNTTSNVGMYTVGVGANTTTREFGQGGTSTNTLTSGTFTAFAGGTGGVPVSKVTGFFGTYIATSGAGGGAGHRSGNGGPGTGTTNGNTSTTGGTSTSPGGKGADGVGINNSGTPGFPYGGGGSGGNKDGSTVQNGGAGANGAIIITYNVNPAPTATVSTTTGAVCADQNVTFSITGTVGAVVTYNLNSGASQTLTIPTSGSATVTVQNVQVTQKLNLISVSRNGCITVLTASATKAVNPKPTIGTVTATPATACGNGTSTVSVTGLVPSSTGVYTYTISKPGTATTTGSQPVTADGNGNATVVTPVLPSNFDGVTITVTSATITSTGCTTNFSTNNTFMLQVVGKTTTYTSNGWNNGAPILTDRAIISANYSLPGNLLACNILVNNNAKVTIPNGSSMTINNDINVASGSTLTVESDANLIQINDLAVNTGNVTVIRNSPMKKNNYTYWSSPVKNQQLNAFSPNTSNSRFYQYLESTNQFETVDKNSNFIPGKGYAIMAPATYSPTNTTVFANPFVGELNNGTNGGTLQFELAKTSAATKGFNMIGNPYASNIDFDQFQELNKDRIFITAYFWTNVDPNRPGSTNGNTAYQGNAYAIYNGTGGVAAAATVGGAAASPKPTGIIKVGQGFIVKAKEDQNGQKLIFNNSIRTNDVDGYFFSKSAEKGKDRFWVNLTTPANNVNTILIGYVPNASDGFELDYDASLFAVGSDSFYSILGDKKLGIQGRSYPLITDDVVALGTKHFETGTYTISLGKQEGIFIEGQDIFLKDKKTNTTTNLSKNAYTFASEAGEFTNRFEIVYAKSSVLGLDSVVKAGIQVYREAQDFVIKSSDKKIVSYELIEMSGRMIKTEKTNAKEIRFDAERLLEGIYIIKVQLQDGTTYTTKLRK